MNATGFQLVLRRTEQENITLDALATRCGVHPALLERFVEYGLLEPCERAGTELFFDVECLAQVRMIERLRHDLGANLAGIAVILQLRERVLALQYEVERLRDHF